MSVRLDLIDLQGRRVRTLADGVLPKGATILTWDGRTADGMPPHLPRSGASREVLSMRTSDDGQTLLADSGLPIISANNMAEAGERVVAAVKGR